MTLVILLFTSVFSNVAIFNSIFIYSASEKDLSSSSHDSNDVSGLEGLQCYIRDNNFSQELLLELTGLRAFLNQKLTAVQAQEESEVNSEMPSSDASTDVEIFAYLNIVDAITLKLKNVRRILLSQRHSSSALGGKLR